MKGHYIPYSVEEMTWLEANRLMVISDYARAFNEAFGRDVAAKNLHALRKRKGWSTGRTGCFAKGQTPHNKGKPHPARGRAGETQFKKGSLSGQAAKNYQMQREKARKGELFLGRKPREFCRWVFTLLGAQSGDTLDDLFPGSGAVGAAWEEFSGARPQRELVLQGAGSDKDS